LITSFIKTGHFNKITTNTNVVLTVPLHPLRSSGLTSECYTLIRECILSSNQCAAEVYLLQCSNVWICVRKYNYTLWYCDAIIVSLK
jgi:hypothetical protein